MKGIYSITNKVNGKIYIGQTSDIDFRWFQHINNLKKNKHNNKYLQNSWNKYGENNFNFDIIEVLENEFELNDKEKYYIQLYKSNITSYGYNLTSGGDNYSLNEESKNKISISKRGQNSNLTKEQVRHIKMCLYCLMERKEICDMFNISPKLLTQIATGKSFNYILSDLNNDIHNLKQKLINERNYKILQLFDEGNTISDICKLMKCSISIIEKCVYKYRNIVEINKAKYQDIYDNVFKLKEEGYNNYNISKILSISPSTVTRYLEGKNNPYKELPFRKITDNDKKNIIHLYNNENKNSYEIGQIYNVSPITIMSVVNNYKYANTEVI